jgi:hypothetical protein
MTLQYTPLEKLSIGRPVDRIKHVQRLCVGKTVLDLGAMDETAFQSKRGKGTWLHEELGRVAATLIGLDNSSVVPESGLRTGERSIIHRGDVHDLEEFLRRHAVAPDVIVAGELIEHVPNPLAFLQGLVATPSLSGKTLVLTTPNATALHTLFLRSGFREWEIIPYYARFTEMKERVGGAGKVFVAMCESAINVAETLCPLVSFGLIGRATL